MPKERQASVTWWFIAVGVVALVWFGISWVLSLMLATAEDNLDMSATTPWPLKWACAVVFFPMRYLQRWDHVSSTLPVMIGMLVNGVFWGLVLLSAYRFLMRTFVPK